MESGSDLSEIRNICEVLLMVFASLSYCYYIAAKVPSGVLRFLSILPVFYSFVLLPFRFSSIYLCGTSAFLLVWLANFKLILFSLDQAPLYPPPPKLFHFICITCLPIKIKPPCAVSQTPENVKTPVSRSPFPSPSSVLSVVKIVLLVLIFYAYNYRQHFDERFILILYSCHMYLQLELVLAIAATPARVLFGFELEPQFNEPFLATSLQDFWGRRWNLMVTSILRPTVYSPVRNVCLPLGSRFASLTAIMAVFTVSGLMHEMMFYYLTGVPPTWEVFSFFILHGLCLLVEIPLKASLAVKFQLHPVVAAPLVVGFVIVTSTWLFWPQLLRDGADDRVINEFSIALDLLKKNMSILMSL